jgi:hypothetical protein
VTAFASDLNLMEVDFSVDFSNLIYMNFPPLFPL